MKPTVPLIMWGWIPFVMQLFQKLSHRRATIIAIILAWMFLPNYSYILPVLPAYDKITATTLAVLLSTFVYARYRLERLEFDALDLVVIFWCTTPVLASLSNGLGLYDGLVASKIYITNWLIPYFVGRMYFTDLKSFRELAWGVFIGGLIYSPLCWVEILLSPQLHNWVYGWHPHDFIQSVRGNSYRPVIFMNHGLMVGMWMAASSLCGLGLLVTGEVQKMIPFLRRYGFPAFVRPWMFVGWLVLTFVACQSLGALLLFIQGFGILFLSKVLKTKVLLILFLIFPAVQMIGAMKGNHDSSKVVEVVRKVSDARAASLQFRLDNEKILVEKALQRPIFGWGGWGRSRVRDETGRDISVTDAYWVIILGTTGVVGLASFYLLVSLPVIRFLKKFPRDGWMQSGGLVMMPLLVLLPLYAQDCLMNDMKNPIFMVIAGGLVSASRMSGMMRFDLDREDADKVEVVQPLVTEVPTLKGIKTRYV